MQKATHWRRIDEVPSREGQANENSVMNVTVTGMTGHIAADIWTIHARNVNSMY